MHIQRVSKEQARELIKSLSQEIKEYIVTLFTNKKILLKFQMHNQIHGEISYLYNTKVWVADCVDYKSNIRHAGLKRVFEWSKNYGPEKIHLTNISHNIDYH